MNINSISALNTKTSAPVFKGLWGKAHYSHTGTLRDNVECDYFEKIYYPCKDERPKQIKEALDKKREELRPFNAQGDHGVIRDYTYVTVGHQLNITREQLAELEFSGKLKHILERI